MALDNSITVKRLTYIKYLYQQGVEQSKLPETIAGFSLMQFHDSVEMFLLLVAENLGEKKFHKWDFMEYWSNIDSLTMRDAMDVMKQRRVSLKHHGSFPSHDDVVESCINVGTFLRENTRIHFDIDFDSISLIDLISYEGARDFLQKASDDIKEGKLHASLTNSRLAFDSLLDEYEENKQHWFHSIYDVGKRQGKNYEAFVRDASLKNKEQSNKRWFEEITKTVNELRDVTKITALGIDYKRYALFKSATPHITRFLGGGYNVECEASLVNRVNLSKDLCSMCINFVIDSAVKLQDCDYNISCYLKSSV